MQFKNKFANAVEPVRMLLVFLLRLWREFFFLKTPTKIVSLADQARHIWLNGFVPKVRNILYMTDFIIL